MTNEELVYLYQQGDKQALETLIKQNEKMVNKLVNRFITLNDKSIDKDDLFQEGCIGLMTAANKYDFENENKAQFITYAIWWINSKIYRYFKSNHRRYTYSKKNPRPYETSLNIPVRGKDGEEGELEHIDFIEGVDYSFENVEEKVYIEQLRKELEQVMNERNTLQEREVLKLHYGWYNNRSMKMSEVGEVFNMSGRKAIEIENKALRKIRSSRWGLVEAKKRYKETKAWRRTGPIMNTETYKQ